MLLLGTIYGCNKNTPDLPAAPSSRTTATPVFPLAYVQSLPLYHEAQQACSHKQFLHAADLLARLAADTSLSARERVFCQEQRAICLQDAGLPAPPVHVTAASMPVAASVVPSPALTPEQANCGPRALLLLCQRFGIRTSLPALQRAAGTTGEGTNLEGLAKAARSVGLKVEGVQVSREALSQVEMPAIAWVNENHYVAVLALQGEGEQGTATIHDPNGQKEQTISQERLLSLCSGYLLLLHR